MRVTGDGGTVERDGEDYRLCFAREYDAPIADVWSAITAPERTARWIGDLRGTLAVGERVDLVMGETADERAILDITECDRPHRLAVGWQLPGTHWTRVTEDLSPAGPERTLVVLRHLGWSRDELPGYGCGWDHYADALAAHLAGAPLPSFGDYYPARLPVWRERAALA